MIQTLPPAAFLLTALFEHGTDDDGRIIQGFDNWENDDDGRGVTAGYAGFTQFDEDGVGGSGDLLAVYERFCELQGHSDGESAMWANWTRSPELFNRLGIEQSTEGHNFRQAQRDVGHALYTLPALRLCAQLGISTALGIASIYDAGVQHGYGGDGDSMAAMIRETEKATAPPVDCLRGVSVAAEHVFIRTFNSYRFQHLSKAKEEATRKTWFESRDRAHALNELAREGKWDLKMPFSVTVFGETVEVK